MPQLKNDPRPKDYKLWVEKYRKIKPVDLTKTKENTPSTSNTRVSQFTIDAGIEPYSGEFSAEKVAHLLRRTLFGIKKDELDTFQQLSISESVNRLLSESPKPSPPVNDYNNAEENREDPTVPFGETWVTAPFNVEIEGARIVSLKSWLLGNFLNQEPTIHEKMILFWHNLLVTQSWDVFIGKASYQYFEMLRTFALGNYKDLIKALTLDPSMLLFLNGTFNQKEAPDENYARELQELFCIGKGPDSKYIEEDVQAAAKVLTGWAINWDEEVRQDATLGSYFIPQRHDTSNKQFSSFYNNKVIEGKEGEDGAQELDELIDMIFDNEETSRYIIRRLYTFFVYHEITDLTEEKVIRPLASIFRENNFEIKPVLSILFQSEHFFHELNRGNQIKNPIDFVIGTWRTLGLPTQFEDDSITTRELRQSMMWNMAGMGLEIADPPSVAGWPAYYQTPQFDQSWITTDTITSRAVVTDSLVYWGFWVNESMNLPANLLDFVASLSNPSEPNEMLEEVSLLLTGYLLAEETLAYLKSILLTGQEKDNYWTGAWQEYVQEPTDQVKKLTVENRLKSTFQHLLQLAENQLV